MSSPHLRDRDETDSKASVDQRVRWPFKRLEGGPLPWHAGGRGFESRRCKLDEFADAGRLAVVDTLTEVAASLAASRDAGRGVSLVRPIPRTGTIALSWLQRHACPA